MNNLDTDKLSAIEQFIKESNLRINEYIKYEQLTQEIVSSAEKKITVNKKEYFLNGIFINYTIQSEEGSPLVFSYKNGNEKIENIVKVCAAQLEGKL